MGNCSTLFYIIDNTDKNDESGIGAIDDFIDNTDTFLNALFCDAEFEVDSKVVNWVLEACK